VPNTKVIVLHANDFFAPPLRAFLDLQPAPPKGTISRTFGDAVSAILLPFCSSAQLLAAKADEHNCFLKAFLFLFFQAASLLWTINQSI
jgi:hypothetical protein